MNRPTEIERFRKVLDEEAEMTVRVMEAIPADKYDFRPDPAGRSIGEMAWHLSEIEGCISFDVDYGSFSYEHEVPDMKRPREVPLLASGYKRVHAAAMQRLETVNNDDLDRAVTFSDGRPMTLRDVLWKELLHHLIHHRSQLVLMCRMAGGTPPGLYGPNREEMKAMIERMKAGVT